MSGSVIEAHSWIFTDPIPLQCVTVKELVVDVIGMRSKISME